MKVADGGRLDLAIKMARAEAKAAFGDDSLYLEKFLTAAAYRGQVFGDGKGSHPPRRTGLLAAAQASGIMEDAFTPLNAAERQKSGATLAGAMEG
jgi:acetyl-CoA carboxylase biotin carboxylase subunit